MTGQRIVSLPPACLRRLHSPRELECGAGGQIGCPGQQRGGGCLCDIVRAANAQGVEWTFEIDLDGFWIYNGPPLDAV